jgi:bacteriochlorophyll 4-vinyl reductase
VLSFLRQEGDAYQRIMTQAGTYAAEWSVESMPSLQRRLIKGAPAWLRGRLLLRFARQLVRESYRGSRAVSRLRRGTASVDLRSSIFCTVREPVPEPLCGFYVAAFTRLLALFDMRARTEVVACRGTGGPTCLLSIAMTDARDLERPEAA